MRVQVRVQVRCAAGLHCRVDHGRQGRGEHGFGELRITHRGHLARVRVRVRVRVGIRVGTRVRVRVRVGARVGVRLESRIGGTGGRGIGCSSCACSAAAWVR